MGIREGGNLILMAGAGPMGLGAVDYAIHCDRKPKMMVVTDISIKDNYGIALFRNGEIDKAEDVYEELFERGTPDFIEAYYNYGLVLEKQGKYDMAADYYQKALGCPEKYLSTVKLEQAEYALSRVEEIIGKGV